MLPRTILFYGRSGCGKGTQAGLVAGRLAKSGIPVLTIETGRILRTFAEGNGYISRGAREVLEHGGLQPAFLPVYLWVKELDEHFTGVEHLLLDGLARRAHEAPVLDEASTKTVKLFS